nr:hypothetical protein [Tanacetum cinerariifolium]
MFHKKNVDFAYLLWEDFVYQVEHKDAKKSNEMYYPRFTKVIIHYFMTKDPSIPRRNKTKASVRKTKSSSDTTITPPTAAGTRLLTSAKGKQHAKSSKVKGLTVLSEDDDDQDDNDDDQDTDNDSDDFVHPKLSIHEEEAKDEESFDPIVQTPENSNDEGRDVQMTDVHTTLEFEDTHVTLTLVNPDGQKQSSSVSSQFVTSMLNPSPDAGIDSLFEITPRVDVQASTIVASLTLTTPTLPPPTIPIISQTLEANFFEFVQTNQFAGAVYSIPRIVERYMDQRMNEAIKVAVQIQSDRLQDEAQAKNEDNKSIQRSDEQRNLYKALVDDYESNKIILDTYEDTITLKRRCDDADKDEKPSARSDRGSKRRREGNKPKSTSAPKEKVSKTTGNISNESTQSSTLTPELLAGPTYELVKGSCKSLVELEFFLEEVYKATTYQLDWNNPEGHRYPHNLLKPLPLIPNFRGRRVIPFDHFINNDLEYLRGDASSRKYTTSMTKTKAADYGHIKWIEDLIIEWHDYKHLDWITVRRDDDKLYKFKEGDFKRLRIQDIEDMLLLLVQRKLTNLTVEERFAFNVSLRMFMRSIVIQRRVKDL